MEETLEPRQAYRPALISWNLTRKCNLKCPHCYLSAGEKEENELSTEDCLALIDEMVELGTEMVILTGGEPLLRRDIYDIARYASDRGIWVVMGTNGVLVNDHVAARMVECGVRGVGISIDSLDARKHDSFRGGPDALKHSVRALDICRRHGLEVLVQTTIMDMNRDEIPELIAFAKEKGAWSFNLYFLVQTGRGQEMNDLSPQETDRMLRRLVESQEEHRPMLVRAKCAPQFKQIAYEMGLGGLESGGCMAGTEYCRITPGGDVTPCPYMTEVAGNIRDGGLTRVWNESIVLQQLRDANLLKGKCGRCEFSQLCGGCRCRAYAASGDYLAEDPACLYEPSGHIQPHGAHDIVFSDAVHRRLERIPISFIREKVRRGLRAYAQSNSLLVVTMADMDQALAGSGRTPAFPTANRALDGTKSPRKEQDYEHEK